MHFQLQVGKKNGRLSPTLPILQATDPFLLRSKKPHLGLLLFQNQSLPGSRWQKNQKTALINRAHFNDLCLQAQGV